MKALSSGLTLVSVGSPVFRYSTISDYRTNNITSKLIFVKWFGNPLFQPYTDYQVHRRYTLLFFEL